MTPNDVGLIALAFLVLGMFFGVVLGAAVTLRFYGAKHFTCRNCGTHTKADEDGCCVHCGMDCVVELCRCREEL